MEFPNLGHHCFEPTCKQLDFLPVKCDCCSNLFCIDHMTYSSHSCPGAYKKDVQVPVCPLCNTPIPVKRGDPPDIAVGRHIDNNCESDTAKNQRKVYTNRCAFKGCRARELMPIKCAECEENFCLRHRHTSDHKCVPLTTAEKAAKAAVARQQKPGNSKDWFGPFKFASNSPTPNTAKQNLAPQGRPSKFVSVQGNMDEDEALARALAASLQDSSPATTKPLSAEQAAQEDEDYQLAQAIQHSEREMRTNERTVTNAPGRCGIS